MLVRVARIGSENIVVPGGKVAQPFVAETVCLAPSEDAVKAVTMDSEGIYGNLVESSERKIYPRIMRRFNEAVRTENGYADKHSGQPVTRARAAYVMGERVWYIPE